MNKGLLFVKENGTIDKHLYSISSREKMFDESWLQELLKQNPSLFSTQEIDESWTDFIPIGREVPVIAGAIYNLY